MRDRVLRDGIESLEDHEALEVYLYNSRPRVDTNEMAHKLIRRFGSLSGVFDADYGALLRAEGVGPLTAFHLSTLTGHYRKYQQSRTSRGIVLDSVEKLGDYLHGYYKGRVSEAAYLLTLDSRYRKLLCARLAEGSFGRVDILPSRVIDIISRRKCSYAVLSHNHTSDIALASGDDIETTKNIHTILKCCDIKLLDHLIFEEDDYISMKQSIHYSYIWE
jgi:DNA repair protein RadC